MDLEPDRIDGNRRHTLDHRVNKLAQYTERRPKLRDNRSSAALEKIGPFLSQIAGSELRRT